LRSLCFYMNFRMTFLSWWRMSLEFW
jgi:hypothetical protein